MTTPDGAQSPAGDTSVAGTEPGATQKPPRRVRRLLARKTKRQLTEGLTPHYPDKWEQR